MGDINIDVLDKAAQNTKELEEFLSQCGLTNHIKNVSRHANVKNSCLDHIYLNCNIINESGTLDMHMSDHLPVFVNRKKSKILRDKVKYTGRSYRNYDTVIYSEQLRVRHWEAFDAELDPNVLWQIVHDNVYQTLDILHPTKEFSVKKYKEPWIANEHLELIRDKDVALKKAKRTKKVEDWNIA